MEQKSMFKRLLSFVVIFTMLFSSFVILAAPAFAADEAADAGKYNAGLNIELSDNEQLLNIDDAAAIKLLTDGDWALNAEAWGGNTNGVVLVQNKNATQQNAWGQANFIWKFEDTPDPYNSIKFGFYSDVNSMIGYPTEEDVWFSNNGVDWVSGYSSSDIGYGETIPDAMTKFDGEATPAGTVIGEIKLRNPQTYKYVKIELYYPKSPFTEENGYVDGTAKPRWEFFGLTEVFDFDLVPTSTVVTDWNAHQYWEGRGGSNGSYAFNNAEDYAASSLTWWKHVAFAPVEGKENTYTIAGIRAAGENSLLAFPEGGFVWCAWGDASAGTPGKAALDLFGTMTEGDIYVLTGFDVAGEFVQNDATITKWVDPDAPVNVALGSSYEIIGLAPSSSYPDTDNKELTNGFRVNGKYNEPGWVGVTLPGSTRTFDVVVTLGDGEKAYNISEIIVNAGAKGTSAGVTEPELATFYSVDGTEWFEFGSYAATGTENASVNASMTVETPVEAKFIKVTVSKEQGKGNLMWLGEIEVYGVEEPAKDKVSIVISGETNVIGGVDAAIEKLADGDWALDAEAWGGNTNGVVLIQNTAATDANKREAIHLIYEFAETPEAYNTIKLGLYSSVESMIGFPTEEDVYFSNDGETWVSGYDDIGYGETIPDAYTTFDGDPTKPGTVIAEVRIENPVTYKYVKLVLRYPESPFTEENGYGGEGNPAKPRWEFFGLTEIAFENVEVSSVITDFNASQYWESRYGRGAGSFAFTTAEEYKVAWDNFITSSYTQVAFAPVAGVENTYEVVVIGNSELTFPEGGFIWTAYNSAEAGSAAEAAINLFKSMTAGEQYTFTGIDFEKGFGEKDAKVEKYIAPVDPEPAVNVALGSKYEIVGLTPSGSYPDTDNKELTDGARVEGKYNDSGWVGVILTSTVRSFDVVVTLGDGETVYNIDKIVVNAGAAGCTCGVTEPELKAFYSVDGSEWLEFGSYTATGTDATNVNATMEVDTPVAAKYIKVTVSKATGAGNLMWLGEIEAYGAEAPVVEDGYKVDGDLKEWGDEWTEVTSDNGYWQAIPKTDTLSYKYQLYTDDTKLYAAFEIDCAAVAGGNGKGTNVRFWIRSDDEATVYTHFYDVFVGGTGAKYNTSKTENKGAAIENSTINAVLVTEGDKTYVEFSIDLAEFNGAEGFDYYVCISNKVNENVCLYHPAVPEPAEGEYRLTNLPYNNWYVPSEEPTVGTKENPAVIEIMPGMRGYMGEGYATLKGGNEYYFTAIVPVDGNVNANFYVIDAEYNGYNVLYSLNGGELLDNYNYDNPGLDNLKAGDVVTIYVKVSDEAPDVDLTAMISLDAVGSMSNPEEIEAGEYTAEIGAGNWSGYNYEFVAEKDGYVKVTIADDNAGWVYSISNVSAGIYGDMHYSDDETVVKADYAKVAAGETATINVSTYGGETTEGTVKFTVSFIPYVESFWTEEEDGRTAPDSNYNPAHAWGYVFDIEEVDPAAAIAEKNIILTSFEKYKACGGNFKYLAHAFFKPTGVDGEYVLVREVNYFGKKMSAIISEGLVTEADFANGAFVLVSSSSASKPIFFEDGTLQYPNWESRVAVWGLGKTIGAKATLGENTLTIEDKPVAKDKLTIELSDNDTILGKTTDEAIDLLTDGDWVLNAGAWGTGTENVVLFQNKNATDSGASGQINIIYEFAETPEPYNNIKLGLYSDVNSMIGYPSEEDIFFSNDGINWVGGYSNASIGYGETIPDAMTKFDGEATPAGTVIAELKLRVPQTYKFVKIEFYFPKSPFTVDNGYAPEAAKPRWEFFGVTEYEIGYVEPSSVITDFNITEYWESRYGRGCGSFAFTTADDYKVAWDNFITSSYTQVAFAPVAGVENTYEVVVIGNSELTFPEGGFIWTAYNSATADSPAEAAINLFKSMTVGEQYTFSGIDFEKEYGEKDASVTKYEAPVVDEGVTVVPNYNFKYAAGNTTILVPWTMGTTLESILDKQYEWFNFAVLTWDAEAGVYKVADVKLGTNIKASADPENGSDFGGLEIPEYGFILGAHSDDTVNHEAIEALKVGDVVYIYGTDLTNATQETALTDAVVTTKAIEGKDAFAPEIVEDTTTSKVVNAFNPDHYSEGSEGANGAYIFTDAAKYGDGSKFAWWRHVALKPVEGTDGLFEVVTITEGGSGTSGGLSIPEGGFIWVAFEWPEGAETSGTYALNVMKTLAVGDKVQFTGLDIANLTTTADATAVKYEAPKPVISGWGAGVEVMTDGYTGLGEITGYEGNNDKIYGFGNNLLVKAEYDFTITITESKFDAITLYALDYAGGCVMLPESVKFVVGDKTYDAVITANENGIATIKAELGEAVTASEIKVLVVMGASPYTFGIFNMFTELEVNKVEDPKPTALLGDVNGNGEIEMYDYILVKRQIMNTIELTDVQMEVADVNGNGEIEMYDYILIKRHIMGTFVIGE